MPDYTEAEKEAYQRGREDGLEQAARQAEKNLECDDTGHSTADCAAHFIRALKEPAAELRIGDATFIRRGNQWGRK